jgi:hypothetical protein
MWSYCQPISRLYLHHLICLLQMQEIGITARLDEVITAPAVIKHVLNGQAALDHSVSNWIWFKSLSIVVHFFSMD